jgi:hypothetical protein
VSVSRPRWPRAAGAIAAALLAVAAAGCGSDSPSSEGSGDRVDAPASASGRSFSVDLYFPGDDGRLHPERRTLPSPDGTEPQVRAVLTALLAGPRDPALQTIFPEGYGPVEVGTVLLGRDGVLIVDLRTPEAEPPPASGSKQEIVTVYSLVNSITLNVTAARRVALLWNGRQRESFSGHLDTAHPLAPDPGLVER